MWKALTVLVLVQPAPLLQWLYRRRCEKAKNSLNAAWHWGALVQSASGGPEGCPRTGTPWWAWVSPPVLLLVCWEPRAVRSKEFQAAEAEILLQPNSRSSAPLCFPNWSNTRSQPSKLRDPAHVLLPLTCVQALHPTWAHSKVLEFLGFFLKSR